MESIKDKVAVIGMGCTKFGERWDAGVDDLIIEAAYEAYEDAGIEPKQIQAAWAGTNTSGMSGYTIGGPLKLNQIPITRCENYCATGSDAFRNACFAVAAGVYDLVLVVGVEKLKDTGRGGLGGVGSTVFQPAAQTAYGVPAAYFGLPFIKHNATFGTQREHLAKIAVKNHHNGTMAEKAHFRREITVEQALNAPLIAWPLGLFDCCAVSDGCAAAIVCRADMAKSFNKDYVLLKGTGFACEPHVHMWNPSHDYLHWETTVQAGKQAYKDAGITNPFKQVSMAEVHDCFTMTELLIYEDLGFCPKGEAKDYIDSGAFTLEGELPVNTDGGLKCFGHPIGASGLRMLYEVYKQLQGKAGQRQIKDASIGLANNLGGLPHVASVIILGRD